jgi:hypothetical protein
MPNVPNIKSAIKTEMWLLYYESYLSYSSMISTDKRELINLFNIKYNMANEIVRAREHYKGYYIYINYKSIVKDSEIDRIEYNNENNYNEKERIKL